MEDNLGPAKGITSGVTVGGVAWSSVLVSIGLIGLPLFLGVVSVGLATVILATRSSQSPISPTKSNTTDRMPSVVRRVA